MVKSLALARSSSSRDSSREQASGHWSHWSDEVIQVAWKLFAQYPSSLTELADISESHAAAAASQLSGRRTCQTQHQAALIVGSCSQEAQI